MRENNPTLSGVNKRYSIVGERVSENAAAEAQYFIFHAPLRCHFGTTSGLSLAAEACLRAAHETATCRSLRSSIGSTDAIGWHNPDLTVDDGLRCGFPPRARTVLNYELTAWSVWSWKQF